MANFGEGPKYQRSVTAYLASLLSKDQTVKDYQIFYEIQEFHPFDDIVLVVNYHDRDDCSLYCIQVKSGKIKRELEKYMKGYHEVIRKKEWNYLKTIGKIKKDNIQFWYFACQTNLTQLTSFQKGTDTIKLQIKERIPNNKSIISNKSNKLFSRNEEVATEHQKFFEDFYIFSGQPNSYRIIKKLKDMWQSNNMDQIIGYLDRYFTKDKKDSLYKVDFEHELLRIYLSNSIVRPTKILPFKKELALAWNELTQSHNVTIVKNETNIETCLFGSILQSISNEINIDQWNKFVDDGGKLSKEYKKQFTRKSMKPETLKDLLIHMWIRRTIPLVLKTDTRLQLLKEFSHLDQHYVILDSDPERRYDEMIDYNLSAIKNLGDKADKLLQSVFISMQGREPISLYTVINHDRRLAKALTCSDVLELIKPRKVYLNKDCLVDDKYMLFIIEAANPGSMNDKGYEPYGDNISVYCHFDTTCKVYDNIKQQPKLENYKIYRVRLDDNKLTFVTNCHESLLELSNFLIDEHGNRAENTVPIIGKVEQKTCLTYLRRHLRKGTLVKRDCRGLGMNEITDSTIAFSDTVFREDHFFKEINAKICAIVGEPGMGKTTLLQSLLQACDSQYYVLFCNLSRLQGDIQKNTEELFNDPLNFLWNFQQESLLYKHFLDAFLRCPKRLILILDSFDEVAPTCEEQVLKLIRKLSEQACLNKIVIGSRLLAVKLLIDQFAHIDIAKIEPFSSEHNGDKYLENWGFNKDDLQEMPSEFAVNPLYLDMLSTICRTSNIDLRSLNIWTLYEDIVNLKISRYIQSTGHQLDKKEKENILKFHWELAVKLIFDSNTTTNTENEQPQTCNYARLGFIKDFDENEEPVFVHHTFAEFFAASWLLKTTVEDDTKYIYQKMLKDGKFDVLRIHSEQFPLHKIVYNNDIASSDRTCERIKTLCREYHEILVQKDGIGRIALHIAAIQFRNDKGRCLETIIHCMRERGYDLYLRDNLLNWTWVDICENNSYFGITKCLPPFLAIQEAYWSYHASCAKESGPSYNWKKNGFNRLYKMIIRYPSLFNIIGDVLFLRYFNNKNFTEFRDVCLNGRLTSIKFPKYFELVELRLTPLHMAVIYSNIIVVAKCLDRGDKINSKDTLGCTPLYYSIGKEEDEIAKLLLEKGANMDLHPNIKWCFNTFQLSLQKGSKEITEMLIDRVNINKIGSIWLYESIKLGDLEVVQMLLKANADPNAEVPVDPNTHFEIITQSRNVLKVFTQCYAYESDLSLMPTEQLVLFDDCLKYSNYYRTCSLSRSIYFTRPLHAAIHARRTDIAELLLGNDADVNLIVKCNNNDYDDCSLFYCAVKCRSIDMIELLLRNRANVNYVNKKCLTPLLAAINDKCINFCNDRQYCEFAQNTLLYTSEVREHFGYYIYYIRHVLENMFKFDWSLNKTVLLQRNLQLVTILLNHNADISFTNEQNLTVLDDALEERNWTMIEILLENGVNPCFSKKIEFTHLLDLVPTEHMKIIELLLKNGVDPNLKTACDVTPLYVAARKRNPDMVKLLLENGATADIETRTDVLVAKAKEREKINVVIWLWDLGETCSSDSSYESTYPDEVVDLIRTVEHQTNINLVEEIDITPDSTRKQLKLVEKLLEYGANLTNSHGTKYIHAVLKLRKKEVDQILIRSFVRFHESEIQRYTAVGYAATQRNQAMIKILTRNAANVNSTNKRGYTPLVSVIREKVAVFVVELLLENGADVNLADEHGNTPLIVAIETKNIPIAEILVKNKAIINYVSKCGLTPLISAVMTRDPTIIRMLLTKGADVNFTSHSGLAPLYAAVLTENVEITKMLFRYGASSDIETSGKKLLFHAATSGHHKIPSLILPKLALMDKFNILGDNGLVERIMHNQATVNTGNEFGSTPLHIAALAGKATVVDALISFDANLNQVDQLGRTALHCAVLMHRKDIVKNLLRRKADATIKDNGDLTPLDYAKFFGYHAIVYLFTGKSETCYDCTML